MVLKKKYPGGLKLSLSLLFMLLFVNLSTTCNAAEPLEYHQLTQSMMSTVITTVGATNFSGDSLTSLTNTFNQYMRTLDSRNDFDWTDYNILFYSANSTNTLYWVLIDSLTPNIYFNTLNNNTKNTYFYGFDHFNYDANNNITGVSYTSLQQGYINVSNINTVTLSNTSNSGVMSYLTYDNWTFTQTSILSYEAFTSQPRYIIWEPHWLKDGYGVAYTRNTSEALGYIEIRLLNTLSGETPTPTPTPTPTGGGGGNNDLSTTNDLIALVHQDITSGDEAILNELTSVPDLSGETISSGDISSALNISFSGDPYSNFWVFLTNGLSNSLTNSNRSINYEFLNHTYTINLDDTIPHYPEGLQAILEIICIYGLIIIIVKQIHAMIITIQSGNMDKLLEMNEESGIVDIF